MYPKDEGIEWMMIVVCEKIIKKKRRRKNYIKKCGVK